MASQFPQVLQVCSNFDQLLRASDPIALMGREGPLEELRLPGPLEDLRLPGPLDEDRLGGPGPRTADGDKIGKYCDPTRSNILSISTSPVARTGLKKSNRHFCICYPPNVASILPYLGDLWGSSSTMTLYALCCSSTACNGKLWQVVASCGKLLCCREWLEPGRLLLRTDLAWQLVLIGSDWTCLNPRAHMEYVLSYSSHTFQAAGLYCMKLR